MAVIRQVIGETIRAIRLRQRRTLRQISASARVSLGYLSEIERGQKEPSSELLAAICSALDVRLSDLFAEVSDTMRREEKRADVARHAAGLVAHGRSRPGQSRRTAAHVAGSAPLDQSGCGRRSPGPALRSGSARSGQACRAAGQRARLLILARSLLVIDAEVVFGVSGDGGIGRDTM